MIGNKTLFKYILLTILLASVQAWSFFGSSEEKKVEEKPVVDEDRVHEHVSSI
jgi:hypothetical protein